MYQVILDNSQQSVSHQEGRMLEYNEAVINLRDKYKEKFEQLAEEMDEHYGKMYELAKEMKKVAKEMKKVAKEMEIEVKPLHGEDAQPFENLAALVISNVEDTIEGLVI